VLVVGTFYWDRNNSVLSFQQLCHNSVIVPDCLPIKHNPQVQITKTNRQRTEKVMMYLRNTPEGIVNIGNLPLILNLSTKGELSNSCSVCFNCREETLPDKMQHAPSLKVVVN